MSAHAPPQTLRSAAAVCAGAQPGPLSLGVSAGGQRKQQRKPARPVSLKIPPARRGGVCFVAIAAPGVAARSRWALLPWQSMRPGLAATRPSSLQSRYVSCALTSHAKTERPTPAKCGPFVLTSIRTIPFVLADMAYHRMSKTRSNRFAGELGVSDKTRTRRSVDRRLMASFQLFGCHILDR